MTTEPTTDRLASLIPLAPAAPCGLGPGLSNLRENEPA